MSIKSWIEEKKHQFNGKVAMFKTAKGALTGDLPDLSELLELAQGFITPETSMDIARNLASFIRDRELQAGVQEIAYIIRRTPDHNSAYIDVVQIENGMMVKTLHQYSERDLSEVLKKINTDDTQNV